MARIDAFLKLGLAQGQLLGTNPFKFGMIGATDSHTSFSNAEEDNYLGKYAVASPSFCPSLYTSTNFFSPLSYHASDSPSTRSSTT